MSMGTVHKAVHKINFIFIFPLTETSQNVIISRMYMNIYFHQVWSASDLYFGQNFGNRQQPVSKIVPPPKQGLWWR